MRLYSDLMTVAQADALLSELNLVARNWDNVSVQVVTGAALISCDTVYGTLSFVAPDTVRLTLDGSFLMIAFGLKLRDALVEVGEYREVPHDVWTNISNHGHLGPVSVFEHVRQILVSRGFLGKSKGPKGLATAPTGEMVVPK